MTVDEIMNKLAQFPGNREVMITDGWEAVCYSGDFEFQEWKENGKTVVDIGVGGTRI